MKSETSFLVVLFIFISNPLYMVEDRLIPGVSSFHLLFDLMMLIW